MHNPIMYQKYKVAPVDHAIKPSVWGYLNTSSYCDVGFSTGHLNFELNCAGVYSK
jgi:hypothetical protein